jgi:hypothetical protein
MNAMLYETNPNIFNLNDTKWPSLNDFKGLTQREAISLFDRVDRSIDKRIKVDKVVKLSLNGIRSDIEISQRLSKSFDSDSVILRLSENYPFVIQEPTESLHPSKILPTVYKGKQKRRRLGKRLSYNSKIKSLIHVNPTNSIPEDIITNLLKTKHHASMIKGHTCRDNPNFKSEGIMCVYEGWGCNALFEFRSGNSIQYISHPHDLFSSVMHMKLHFIMKAVNGWPSYTNIQNFDDLIGNYFLDDWFHDQPVNEELI